MSSLITCCMSDRCCTSKAIISTRGMGGYSAGSDCLEPPRPPVRCRSGSGGGRLTALWSTADKSPWSPAATVWPSVNFLYFWVCGPEDQLVTDTTLDNSALSVVSGEFCFAGDTRKESARGFVVVVSVATLPPLNPTRPTLPASIIRPL